MTCELFFLSQILGWCLLISQQLLSFRNVWYSHSNIVRSKHPVHAVTQTSVIYSCVENIWWGHIVTLICHVLPTSLHNWHAHGRISYTGERKLIVPLSEAKLKKTSENSQRQHHLTVSYYPSGDYWGFSMFWFQKSNTSHGPDYFVQLRYAQLPRFCSGITRVSREFQKENFLLRMKSRLLDRLRIWKSVDIYWSYRVVKCTKIVTFLTKFSIVLQKPWHNKLNMINF